MTSDFFVACFFECASTKRGSFSSKLRYALSCASSVPLDEIFFIPIRFENYIVPARVPGKLQDVDLFPDWDGGLKKVVAIIARQDGIRRRKSLPLAV
ncbi:MAG TPA: hypothetical protein VEV37_03840 [Bryobacteraceae bacterium]|nr:hypothetical protein [Bryobacteraceae bacterium]